MCADFNGTLRVALLDILEGSLFPLLAVTRRYIFQFYEPPIRFDRSTVRPNKGGNL